MVIKEKEITLKIDFVNDIKNKNIFDNDEIDLISSYVKKMIINLYSKGTYKSFYNKEKDKLYINDKPLGFLTLFLKKLLIKNNNFNDRESLLKKLLMEDYLYFKKLFLFLVTKDIDKFENIFWDNFNTNNVDLLIKEYYFADELRHFFNSLSELSNKHCKILEDKIEEGPNHLKTMNLENVENYILLWKQKRFKALSHLD